MPPSPTETPTPLAPAVVMQMPNARAVRRDDRSIGPIRHVKPGGAIERLMYYLLAGETGENKRRE